MSREEEAKDEMLYPFKDWIGTLNEIQSRLEYWDDIKIPNIAITYNNKIVEILQLYRKHNVSLADSELRIVIICYLAAITSEAIESLQELSEILKKIDTINKSIYGTSSFLLQRLNMLMSQKLMAQLGERKNQLIEEYEKRDKELFDFDIERDICKVYVEQSEFFTKMERVVNRFNEGEERFINNCNIDLRNLGIKAQLPCKDQKDEKMITLDNINDNIAEIMTEKLENMKTKYCYYPYIKTALETYLIVLFSALTIEMQSGNYEEAKRLSELIESFDDEKDLEKGLGEYIEIALDDEDTDEKKIWNRIHRELIVLHKEDMFERLQEDLKNGKYQYALDLVNKELEKGTTTMKKAKKPEDE